MCLVDDVTVIALSGKVISKFSSIRWHLIIIELDDALGHTCKVAWTGSVEGNPPDLHTVVAVDAI